ncbi:MAG: hypothetical protein KDB80_17330, partial [Planctomycetes bacterium]|nr:hypothetical protein [Planctomycetota bacterium]
MHSAPDRADPRAPRELVVPLLVFGVGVVFVGIATSIGPGWTTALLVATAWWLDRSRKPSATPRIVVVPPRHELHRPPSFRDFHAATIATHGRFVPVLAHAEYAARWFGFAFRRWSLPWVATLAVVLVALQSASASHDRTARTQALRLAWLTLASDGPTGPETLRRGALESVVRDARSLEGLN